MESARLHRILGLGLPIIGAMVSQTVLNVVDTAMVGTLGDAAIAAVGLGGFVVFTCQALILGISTGVQATVARRQGEGRPDRAARIINTALALIAVIAPLLSVILLFLVDDFYPLLNDDPQVIALGVPYLRVRIVAITFVAMNFAFRGYWNAMDRSRVYMVTLVIAHLANILLNYMLIFGHFGAPALGVTGAGIASTIAMGFGTAIYLAIGLSQRRGDGFLRGLARREDVRALIRLSVPAGLQQFFFSAGFVATFWIIGKIGTAEVAAANVLVTVMLVALLPGLGLGLACATLVGQALGRCDPDDAYRWGWDVARVAVVFLSVLALPMVLLPDQVLAIFLHDPQTRALARWPLRVVGLLMPFEAVGFSAMHGLLSAGAAKRVMAVSIGCQWLLFMPLAYLVGPVLGHGLLAVWVLQGAYRALQFSTFIFLWFRRGWVQIRV